VFVVPVHGILTEQGSIFYQQPVRYNPASMFQQCRCNLSLTGRPCVSVYPRLRLSYRALPSSSASVSSWFSVSGSQSEQQARKGAENSCLAKNLCKDEGALFRSDHLLSAANTLQTLVGTSSWILCTSSWKAGRMQSAWLALISSSIATLHSCTCGNIKTDYL